MVLRVYRADATQYWSYKRRGLLSHLLIWYASVGVGLACVWGRVPTSELAAIAAALCLLPVAAAAAGEKASRAKFRAYSVELQEREVTSLSAEYRKTIRRDDVISISESADGRLFLRARLDLVMVPPWV